MASTPNIATDSARDLNDVIGNDSTATFEDDPKFIDSNPTETASSENLGADDVDETDDVDDIADEDEDEDVDEDEDEGEDIDEDEEDDDLDDEDPDDEEEEDDAEEADAPPALSADGLLGYEDEADDVNAGRDREQGDEARSRAEAKLKDGEDDDAGDVEQGADEDKLREDETVDLDEDDSLATGEAARIRTGLQTSTAVQASL